MAFRCSCLNYKAKPRKFISRSPLKLSAEEYAREFGPQYGPIDARIGNQMVLYDVIHAEWIADRTTGSRETIKWQKAQEELEKENNAFRAKVDVLLEMFAETTAEYGLRRAV